MRRTLLFTALSLFVPQLACAGPKAGDAAPDFEMAGSDGKTYRLADFAKKKVVVVAWFPKAFTGG